MKKQFGMGLSVLLIMSLCACSIPATKTVTLTNTTTHTQNNTVTSTIKETQTKTINTTDVITVKEISTVRYPYYIEKTLTETITNESTGSNADFKRVEFEGWSNCSDDAIGRQMLIIGKPENNKAIFNYSFISYGNEFMNVMTNNKDWSYATSTSFEQLFESSKEFTSSSILNESYIDWHSSGYYEQINIPYYLNATCTTTSVYYRYNSSNQYEATTTQMPGWTQGKLYDFYNDDDHYLIINGDLNNTSNPVEVVILNDTSYVSYSSATTILTYQDMSITQTSCNPWIGPNTSDTTKYACLFQINYLVNDRIPVSILFGL